MECHFYKEFFHYQNKTFEVEDPIETLHIVNSVFNAFSAYTAIMLNILSIYAMRKTSSLPKPLKTLLLSLAVSDLGVGLLVQPLYTSLLVHWLKHKSSCSLNLTFHNILCLFSVASFSGVVAVSVDRFLAIHFHLRYQEHVTYKRVVTLVFSIWLLSLFISFTPLWIPPVIFNPLLVMLAVAGLVFIAMVYSRIYLAVRRHNRQIHTLQVQHGTRTGEKAHFAFLVKSAFSTFYVYLVLFVCYLPHLVTMAAIEIQGTSIALKKSFLLSMTPVFLNSILNPVIYFWKMRHIRHVITGTLRNMNIWLRCRSLHSGSPPTTPEKCKHKRIQSEKASNVLRAH